MTHGGRWRVVVAVAAAGAVAAMVASPAEATVARASAPPTCSTAALRVWWGEPGDGAAGSMYFELQLSNVSTHTCVVRGWPGVSAVDASGHRIGRAADWDRSAPAVSVVLAPGATAHAVLRVVNVGGYDPATCHPVDAAGLRVFPPAQVVSDVIGLRVRACSAAAVPFLSVRAARSGAGIPGYSQ